MKYMDVASFFTEPQENKETGLVDVGSGEIIFGRLPPELINFYERLSAYKEDVEGIFPGIFKESFFGNVGKFLKVVFCSTEEEGRYAETIICLEQIFRNSVRLYFPESASFENVGIRKGYLAVGIPAYEVDELTPKDIEELVPKGFGYPGMN